MGSRRKDSDRGRTELFVEAHPTTSEAHGVPFYVPMMNPLMKSLLRLGVPMGPMTLITVEGRRSGKSRTTPVGLMEADGRKFIFGTFGDVGWTKNLRAAGKVIIGRGRRRRVLKAREMDTQERAEVLRKVLTPYLSSRLGSQFLKMGYDLDSESSATEYLAEARRHPGFELTEVVDS